MKAPGKNGNITGFQTCKRCHESKPLTEYYRDRANWRLDCKVCVLRQYHEAGDYERRSQLAREWRARNLEHYRKYQRDYHREWCKPPVD